MIPGFLEKIHQHLFSNIQDKTLSIIENEQTTYEEFATLVLTKYSSFKDISDVRIGIYIDNHIDVYAAIIACWLCGKSYVPIKSKWPTQRINQICKISNINYIYTRKYIDQEIDNIHYLSPKNSVASSFAFPVNLLEIQFNEAYVLFTSGTTGEPKGVSISFENIDSFFDGFELLNYQITEDDRFLQMFDLTFDLSICSFMIPMVYGASFYTLNEQLVKPLALYDALETHKITFALMIPSSIHLLDKYLDEIELPNLRVTQFCGEALTFNQIQKWKSCVPHCQIDNVYGPTEATIYCTRYIAHPNENLLNQNGIVCIGQPLAKSTICLNDEDEIFIGGHQVTKGYLNNALNTQAFTNIVGDRYYKSGDIGKSLDNHYYCLGRKDQQIKVQGYRIELTEIENAFGQLFPIQISVAVSKQNEKNYTEIILFTLINSELTENIILMQLEKVLPEYMLPRKVVFIEEFKYNINGKLDRNYLKQWTN
jgi:acyl-coenzyme A synthetase/AMP-(fatty) acid ligase